MKGNTPLLNGGMHLCRREVPEHRPFELPAGDRALPDLDLFGKNAPVGQAQHGAAFQLGGEHLL